ncbi:MAG TPA: hypothetical protein VM680_00750, partial [Verrucomicrobiae bacterium]|nr:hypothetical protein [Verrucomicrobiae bacterium]
MKTRFFFPKLMVASVLVVSVVCTRGADAQRSFERTRLELQQQGFKTDLKDFDFSTTPEISAREAALNSIPRGRPGPVVEDPNLMEPARTNEAIVVWKQNSLRRQTASWPDESRELAWEHFNDLLNENESEVDAARAAILTGPIRFGLDASRGNNLLLRHLPLVKKLTQTLNGRAMLALHDGDRDGAWTNLLAATRLTTAWIPEPLEVSHRVRFDNAKSAFKATWQAMQTNGWTDDQLSRLQAEWESADFLSHLPDLQAFRRASDLKMLQSDSL